jgi:hypothetical protein
VDVGRKLEFCQGRRRKVIGMRSGSQCRRAGRAVRRRGQRLLKGGSHLVDRVAPATARERLDQSLYTAPGRCLFTNESVSQIEEEPAKLPHRRLISDFDYAERALISQFADHGVPSTGRNRPVWYQIANTRFVDRGGYARFVNTNQSISSVTASAGLMLER